MSWTPPSDVSTGQALTALLWNNLLGTSGSLKYVYDQLNTPVNLQVSKSTDTAIPTNGSSLIAFNGVSASNNFPFTPTSSSIVIPVSGMYAFSFRYRTSVSTVFRIEIANVLLGLTMMDTNTNVTQDSTLTGIASVTAGTTITCTAHVTTAATLYGLVAAESSMLRIALVK